MRDRPAYPPGRVLAARQKGAVTWQARISADRGRLEVVGLVPPAEEPTIVEPLTERELCELLGESGDLHDEDRADIQRQVTTDGRARGLGVTPIGGRPGVQPHIAG